MIVQTRLGAPLLQALQRLLAVLLSSAGGQDLVLHNPVAMGALLKALDPEADPYGPVFASVSQPARSALLQLCFIPLLWSAVLPLQELLAAVKANQKPYLLLATWRRQ